MTVMSEMCKSQFLMIFDKAKNRRRSIKAVLGCAIG